MNLSEVLHDLIDHVGWTAEKKLAAHDAVAEADLGKSGRTDSTSDVETSPPPDGSISTSTEAGPAPA